MTRLAYLCSELPALSHTFIAREMEVLEDLGFLVHPVSINPPNHVEKMSLRDQNTAAAVYVLKRTPLPQILVSLVREAVHLPRFLRVFFKAAGLVWFHGPRDPFKFIGYFVQAVLLHRWARRQGLAHVHVHFGNAASTVALLASQFGALSYSLSIHGPDEFYGVEANNLPEKVAGAEFVRCISYFCRSQLQRISPVEHWEKMHIVRCGLFPEEVPYHSPEGRDGKNLLCVGRTTPSKGQSVLLQAAGLLKARGFDFRLKFLGGGEDLESLRRQAVSAGLQSVVELPGPVGHEQVKKELETSGLFILPSFAEGIPIALMEAMAAGIPVITTRIAGIPELITDKEEGFLVSPSDPVGLADCIGRFLDGSADPAVLAPRALRKVQSEYNVAVNTKGLAELFQALEERP